MRLYIPQRPGTGRYVCQAHLQSHLGPLAPGDVLRGEDYEQSSIDALLDTLMVRHATAEEIAEAAKESV